MAYIWIVMYHFRVFLIRIYFINMYYYKQDSPISATLFYSCVHVSLVIYIASALICKIDTKLSPVKLPTARGLGLTSTGIL